jgi:quinohemoprotein ethanol dehydrogenase
LRRSAALPNAALWKNIVIDGALEPNGMIGWSQFLSPEEAETIRAYVGQQARALQAAEAQQAQQAPPAASPPAADTTAL